MTVDPKDPQGFRSAFYTVAEMVRRDFPEETKGLIFADPSTPDGKQAIENWHEKKYASASPAASERKAEEYKDMMKSTASLTRVKGSDDIIVVDGETLEFFAAPDANMNLAIVTAHEAGHAIAKNGTVPKDYKYNLHEMDASQIHVDKFRHEIAADSFAVPYLISNNMARMEQMDTLSLHRAIDACLGPDMVHATSLALDTISIEYKESDLAAMKPEQVKGLADAFAERFASNEDPRQTSRMMTKISPMTDPDGNLSQFMDRAPQPVWQDWLRKLADFCETADPNSQAFYPAAKTVSEVLATGRLSYPAPRTFDVTGEFWDNKRDMIAIKALEISMEKKLDPYPRRQPAP